MIDLFADISEHCRLSIPKEHHRPIAIIGAGAIVDDSHLPAYALAGVPIAGITDTNLDRAADVANQHGIGRVYNSVEELLADDEIAVVDIAVPSSAQPEIFKAAAGAGKHILAQKPFAESLDVARELVNIAERAGIVAAVNQQMRFYEAIAAAHRMVKLGWIGDVTSFSITVNSWTPWELWGWLKDKERLEIMVHSIHYHDAVRWFMGEPESVYAMAGRTPGQYPKGETRTISSYKFGQATALIHVNHMNVGRENTAEFRIEGVSGSIRGTFNPEQGRIGTLEVSSLSLPTDGWLTYPVTQRWFPNAFIGPMAALLDAIATGSTPHVGVADNVKTIELVDALYQSIENNQVVQLNS